MRRREFIILLGGAAAWVSPARAQEPRRAIGVLGSPASSDAAPGTVAAFVQGLRDTGFIEGNNINIEWRWAEGQYGPFALAGGRTGQPRRGRDRRLGCSSGVCGEGGNQNHPDCIHDRCRSSQDKPR